MKARPSPRLTPMNTNTIQNMTSSYAPVQNELQTQHSCIFLKNGKTYKKVNFDDIIHVKALGAYCIVKTKTRDFTISASLKSVLDQLQYSDIVRCHRSYAININHIDSFDDTGVTLVVKGREVEVPVSVSYRGELMEKLPRMKSS
ncbi:MAG: LytTR family DNA-binding domain-containing protein [Saprospiraceae bacterium]|nr:LytTR family DNA-binding domain-containing protein [Saprospiraceae bacterium]